MDDTERIIAQALQNEGILTPEVLAYAMATIRHETAGTMKPIREYGGPQQAIKLGYSGGKNYYGRGYIQLTHDYNYKQIGERIGLGDELLKNPDLALNPEISAKILAAFFKDRGVATQAQSGNFIAARRPINPDNKGQSIAQNAYSYLKKYNLQPKIEPTKTSNLGSIKLGLEKLLTVPKVSTSLPKQSVVSQYSRPNFSLGSLNNYGDLTY
jgi:hypothetical protein